MRKLQESELFVKYLSNVEKTAIFSTLNTKLRYNVGIIKPENLELELLELKKKAKSAYIPLANEAIAMYEANGHRIRLFNISNNGQSPVPAYIPFLPDMSRNFAADPSEGEDSLPVVFMNMYRIGNWNSAGDQYINIRASSDLYSVLESGLFSYKLVCRGMDDQVFQNKVVLENLTRVYTKLFLNAVVKIKSLIYDPIAQDTAKFVIAKFFLTYCLKKQPSDMTNSYAYLATSKKVSRTVIESQEETFNIDYSTLSGFLNSFGQEFFRDNISLVQFISSWVKLYGDGMLLAIEYVPYLIHFIFSPLHGTTLGGTCRLSMKLSELQDEGLNKLYTAMINILR